MGPSFAGPAARNPDTEVRVYRMTGGSTGLESALAGSAGPVCPPVRLRSGQARDGPTSSGMLHLSSPDTTRRAADVIPQPVYPLLLVMYRLLRRSDQALARQASIRYRSRRASFPAPAWMGLRPTQSSRLYGPDLRDNACAPGSCVITTQTPTFLRRLRL